ncbi:hypothetical protein EMQ25_17295 [Arsenicitalea aurantiaca]|uniref:Mannosylglycerate hydrolase MGH1-like glycoside hydrolase domain-containing protein n=1 Tax=Arsenicitalea aurantiaca TaxID=1783274 RepID=A0A433X2M7_9HYPH|nr:hypothetical protein [Arsenicitalea aurantiaca]RUT28339.1 hypothetical protein EMQ25_17295 [Arsenicitalea aurantiaca]
MTAPRPPEPEFARLLGLVPEGAGADPWYRANVPLFACADPVLERLYYYRAWVMRKHITFHADLGISLISEFDSPEQLYWAGARNTIVCASDHHINEARWLADPRPAREHLRFLLTDPGAQPRNYASALGASALGIAEVTGDVAPATALLEALIANHEGWRAGRTDYPHDNGFDPERGLYWNTGCDSSGEYNLASAQLNEPLRGIQGYKIRGGAGYRPDINADMYADLDAIARIADAAGRRDVATTYRAEADALRARAHAALWDAERGFYMHRWRRDEYADGDRHGAPSIRAGSFLWQTNALTRGVGHQPEADGRGRGRELTGLMPWYRGMAPDTEETAAAWQTLFDPEIFDAPFGPTTAERGDPWFSVQFDCRANGNAFPLQIARVLNGLARMLATHRHTGGMDAAAYRRLFMRYVALQHRDGVPYLGEFHHPFEDRWVVDRPIGSHYFHSSFIDLVITGLLGLRPGLGDDLVLNPLMEEALPFFSISGLGYHGHDIALSWDSEGARLGLRGFCVFIDGTLRHHADRPGRVTLALS